jgi:hypothetical protein
MNKKSAVFSVILIFSASIFLISCGEQKAKWAGTIEEEDEDGFEVIKRYRVNWTI